MVCGLFLVIFVEPPTEWWTGGDTLSGDWKPTILAVLLMAAFVVINAVPQARALFALAPLGWTELGLVAVAVAIWLPLVRLFWRTRLIARFWWPQGARSVRLARREGRGSRGRRTW